MLGYNIMTVREFKPGYIIATSYAVGKNQTVQIESKIELNKPQLN